MSVTVLPNGIEYKRFSNWPGAISVRERLPELNQVVLLFDAYDKEWLTGYRYNETEWVARSGMGLDYGHSADATHWLPLPLPPEAK